MCDKKNNEIKKIIQQPDPHVVQINLRVEWNYNENLRS
jgi:hypothetical protein